LDNQAENAVRDIAMGRKVWMFYGNHDAAENAAIMDTLFRCCKTHGIIFRDWFVYFLNHAHEYDNDYSKNLDELLPHNFLAKNSENLVSLA